MVRLRSGYRSLIVEHAASLHSEKKDIDGLLWKNCFYRQIEDFRKSIKRNSSQLEVSDGTSFALREKQQVYLAKLAAALLKFLADSVVFYHSLMQEVRPLP